MPNQTAQLVLATTTVTPKTQPHRLAGIYRFADSLYPERHYELNLSELGEVCGNHRFELHIETHGSVDPYSTKWTSDVRWAITRCAISTVTRGPAIGPPERVSAADWTELERLSTQPRPPLCLAPPG